MNEHEALIELVNTKIEAIGARQMIESAAYAEPFDAERVAKGWELLARCDEQDAKINHIWLTRFC